MDTGVKKLEPASRARVLWRGARLANSAGGSAPFDPYVTLAALFYFMFISFIFAGIGELIVRARNRRAF